MVESMQGSFSTGHGVVNSMENRSYTERVRALFLVFFDAHRPEGRRLHCPHPGTFPSDLTLQTDCLRKIHHAFD